MGFLADETGLPLRCCDRSPPPDACSVLSARKRLEPCLAGYRECHRQPRLLTGSGSFTLLTLARQTGSGRCNPTVSPNCTRCGNWLPHQNLPRLARPIWMPGRTEERRVGKEG